MWLPDIYIVLSSKFECFQHLSQAKDIGHIWELGGGTFLSKLIDIPINVETIKYVRNTACLYESGLPGSPLRQDPALFLFC